MPSRDIDPASLVHGFVNQAGGLTPEAIQFLEQMRKMVQRTASALRLGTDERQPDLRPLGVGQSWQDMTSQREFGETYTNDTGRTIGLIVSVYNLGATVHSPYLTVIVDSLTIRQKIGISDGTAGKGIALTVLVPAGSTYRAGTGGGATDASTLDKWLELR